MSRDYDVVIPTHGRDLGLLLAAVDSVLGQTEPPTRVIVVADGAPHVVEWLASRRPGVEVITYERSLGAGAARQAGIAAATATWVTFLDDDDLWATRKQQVLLDYTEQHPGCDAVRAGYWMFSSTEDDLSPVFGQQLELVAPDLDSLERAAVRARPRNDLTYLDIRGRSLELMLERNRGVIDTTMVRRAVLERIPPVPPGLQPGDDHLLFCHVAAATEWHLVPERLAYYRLHPAQDSRRGDAAAALGILQSLRIAWELDGPRSRRRLPAYGRLYAAELRRLVWQSVRQNGPGDALRVYRAGLPLLPRTRHRLAAAVPEPVVWRLRHVVRARRRDPSGPEAPPW